MALVTIAVPVYNVGKYLEQCLDSIVNQTVFADLELLLVDDNSTDNSSEIINEYCCRYSNVFGFKNQRNLGSSESRNLALNHAKGKFIYFLDGDDLLKTNECIEKLIGSDSDNNDLIVARMLRWYPETDNYEEGYHASYQNTPEFTQKTIEEVPNFYRHVCGTNMLIKLNFLRKYDIYYSSIIKKFEDDLFTFKLQSLASGIAFRHRDCYLHRQHRQSKMNLNVVYDYQDCLYVIKEAAKFIKNQPQAPENYSRYFLDCQFNRLRNYFQNTK